MNYDAEIREAMQDFQQTQFGGWAWVTTGPVVDKSVERYAKFADGTEINK